MFRESSADAAWNAENQTPDERKNNISDVIKELRQAAVNLRGSIRQLKRGEARGSPAMDHRHQKQSYSSPPHFSRLDEHEEWYILRGQVTSGD